MNSGNAAPPRPIEPFPSPRQLKWHELGFYGFIHFTVNTFTDKEWGYGDEDPAVFTPASLDAGQWAQTARDAGMRGLILTCKHHDGFCLWPSRYTEHSVKNSPWKGGRGDVVRELSEACAGHGLKFGVYLSPWDRNHADYGRPAYIAYYRNQLRELLTEYGPVFEVWFDGANGGEGYYGGARETREIDRSTYYDWEATWNLVRELQPEAVMFSDMGPDIRWVGNEDGCAGEPCWATYSPRAPEGLALGPGQTLYQEAQNGHEDGKFWMPAECDVSIRPGWFYHESQDPKVKTVAELLNIYYRSVGLGANLLLNLPPDRRGLIHEGDVERLRQFRKALDAAFAADLASTARATASNVRGGARAFEPANALDGRAETYWATDDGVTTGCVELSWEHPVRFDRIVLREHIPLGQRVQAWVLETDDGSAWRALASGAAIGPGIIVRFAPVEAARLRLRITQAKACPTLAQFAVYCAPTPSAPPP